MDFRSIVTAIFKFSKIIIFISVGFRMKRSGQIFIYLIIVVALCLSGCLQQGPSTNRSSITAPTASANYASSNQTSANPAPMNMNASSGLSPNAAIIYLMAKNMAFNESAITVPAGANVTVYFDNQDSGTPHNFAVYDSGAASQTIFQGKIINGPAKITYIFTAPDQPGNYIFRCDVHPTIMTGRFIVQPSGAAPSAGVSRSSASSQAQNTGAQTQNMQAMKMSASVSIKDFAFDPSTITVPAGTTVIWTNLDTVPHTVTDTKGKFDSGIMGQGNVFNYTFTDPGTYSYYCTIHPYMKGQVVVTPYGGPYPQSEIQTAVPISTTSPQPFTRITVDLLAKDMSFDKDNLTAIAGAQVNIDFFNLDVGVPHNFAVYANSEAKTVIYQGPVIIGPKQITYTFNAPVDPGIYFFRCDIHPKVMTGNFYVVSKDNLLYPMPGSASQMQPEAAPSQNMTAVRSGSQSAAVDLAAENIAFDKGTITVPAGAKVAINFNNKDSGVPHNFAVYTDSSANTAIFKGNIITGPARTTYTFTAPDKPGTYFFRCDLHPVQMTGQFVVESAGTTQKANASEANASSMNM